MKVIFLDFDGVMDTAYYDAVLQQAGEPVDDRYGLMFDPECARCLGLIIEAMGADIVVSSTWKDFMTYKEILAMWRYRGLPGFVTDVTPTLSSHRGDEIDAWLSECREACNYVIIDDMCANNFNDHHQPHLLVVNPFTGLDEDTAHRAIRILNRE